VGPGIEPDLDLSTSMNIAGSKVTTGVNHSLVSLKCIEPSLDSLTSMNIMRSKVMGG
jgi:hypothetical protein